MSSRVRALLAAGLRATLYPGLEAAWLQAFAVAGRLAPPRLARAWDGAGGGTVLIVAPHPDDETAGCGGAACLHGLAGDTVTALVLTDGRASRAGDGGPALLAVLRAGEARAAARALGLAGLELAGLPEGEWALEEGTAVIRRALLAHRPAVVYAPSCVDYHPEHVRVASACARALREIGAGAPRIRIYETLVPLGSRLVNLVADTSAVVERKQAALDCYSSQRLGLVQVRRRDRYTARLFGCTRTAEAFCELPAERYAAMSEAGRWSGRPPFRGLRGRPLTDPLAYLVGRRARLGLRRRLV